MAATLDCRLFFKRYQHPIDYSPYGKIPKHLKPMLDQIIDEIEDEYEFDAPINRQQVKITSIYPIRVLELDLQSNEKFYVVEEGTQWNIYDEVEYENTFSDSQEIEDVYIPPN